MGSPLWQTALFFLAGLFLLWETWRGWRAGVVRAGIQFGAIVLSAVLGYAAAQVVAIPFGGFGTFNGMAAGAAAGLLVGLVVFFGIWLIGALLFKRTEQQGSGLFKLFWGTGGAFFGFLIGICLLLAAVSAIKALGTMAEAQQPVEPGRPQPAVAGSLVTLKDSLELGPAGKMVESVDVVPPDIYEMILQIGRLGSDQEVMMRFMEYPGIQDLMQNPRIVELVGDPGVVKAVESKNYLGLLTNKALLSAIEDPKLAAELQKIDLRAALKFATATPTASPTPPLRKP